MGSTKFRAVWLLLILGVAHGQIQISPFLYNIQISSLQPDNLAFTATSAVFAYLSGVKSSGEETLVLEAENFNVTSLQVRNITDLSVRLYPSVLWNNKTNYSIMVKLNPYTTKIEVLMTYEGKIYPPGQKGLFISHEKKIIATDLYPDGARRVFPCIQDPQFKTPFSLSVDGVPEGWNYIINNFPMNTGNVMTVPLPTFGVGLIAGKGLKVDPLWEDSTIYYSGPKSSILETVLSDSYFQNLASTVSGGKISVIVIHGLAQLSSASYGLVFISKEVFANDGQPNGVTEMHGQIMTTLNGLGKHFLLISVTPRSWSEHWISDSLTLYLQYRIAGRILNCSSLSGAEVVRTSLTDGNPTVVDPNVTIDTMTSTAIYPSVYKGCALLMMLDDVMDTDISVRISEFIQNMAGKTATTTDFLPWLFPDKKPDDINEFLFTWIYKNDFPCVKVVKNNISFLLSQSDCWQKSNSEKWWIPVAWSLIDSDNHTRQNKSWLKPNTEVMISFNSTSLNQSYLSVNQFGNGLYRQIYDDDSFFENLLLSDLSDGDKGAKLDDAFYLAWTLTTSKPITLFLNSLSSLSSKDGYATWKSAINAITIMSRAYYSTDLASPLQARLGQVISEAYTDVASWVWSKNHEVNLIQRMRASDLVKAACWMDVSTCRIDALNAALNGAYNPDVWSELMCAIMAKTNSTDSWYKLFRQYQPKGNQYRRAALLNALACVSPNSELINDFLELILLENKFPDDIFVAFEAIYNQPEHASEAVKFLSDRAVSIKNVVGSDVMKTLIIGIGNKLTTAEQIQQLGNIRSTFMDDNNLEEAANEAINSATITLQISSLLDSEIRYWLGSPVETTKLTTASEETTLYYNDNPHTLKHSHGAAFGVYESALLTGSVFFIVQLLT